MKAYRKKLGNCQISDVTTGVGEATDIARSNTAFFRDRDRVTEVAKWRSGEVGRHAYPTEIASHGSKPAELDQEHDAKIPRDI